MATKLTHVEQTLANPFGEPINVRLCDDGRIAIEGIVDWEGERQKAWIPVGPRFVPKA